MELEDLRNRFEYHAPDADKAARHEAVRHHCHTVAVLLNQNLPEGREKSLAITKLEEAMFWANAAIARHPRDR